VIISRPFDCNVAALFQAADPPGLLCFGDAAHAMSPAGGVGINLAIQDPVAAANMLSAPLSAGQVNELILERVQRRREFPTRVTQFLQVNAHKALDAVFKTNRPIQAPWQLKVVDALPGRNGSWDTSSAWEFGRSMWWMPKGYACLGPCKE
jgi:2-polyprenyl-6-methoxyphenol hydroxylase-like FAD-dependent oxidoreductase